MMAKNNAGDKEKSETINIQYNYAMEKILLMNFDLRVKIPLVRKNQ